MHYLTKCVVLQCQYHPISPKVEVATLKRTLYVFWHNQEVHYGNCQHRLKYVKDFNILINHRL